jgi:hypothetical protein
MIKNSYHCSLLSDTEKKQKIADWEQKWQRFIKKYSKNVSIDALNNQIWNTNDDSLFELFKSVHWENSTAKITAKTDIHCKGGKFVIPQSKCISYCSLATGDSASPNC